MRELFCFPDSITKEKPYESHTKKQVQSFFWQPFLGEPFTFENEAIPVHDVSIEATSDHEVTIHVGMDGYKETCFTVPLGEPLATKQEYAEEVLRTYAGEDTWKDKLTLGSLGLAGESGEVIDAIKKWLYAGHGIDPLHLLEEIGDVLWYLALMCTAFGWSLDDAIAANIRKLRNRFPDGFDPERSINR